MSNKTKLLRKIDERVATTGGGGVPGGEATATPTAPAAPQPGAPQNLAIVGSFLAYSALAATAVVNLSWRDPVSAGQPDKYQIQWAADSVFTTPTTREAARGQLTAALDSLPVATLAFFRVRAIVRGVVGAWSSTVSTTTPDDLSAPNAPSAFTFAWDGVTGDLVLLWVNPASRNLRDVRVQLWTGVGGTLLLTDASTVGRFVLPLSRNRQLSGGPRTSLYVVLTSRSVRNVLSVTDLTGTATISAPATPGSVAHNWSAAPTTAPANWRITWIASANASGYRLTIDGVSRNVNDTAYDYPVAMNASEHSNTPDPALSYSLVAVNALGQSSTAASGTATNSAPPATSITALGVFSTIALSITASAALDLRNYRVRIYKDTVLQSGETFFTAEPSPIYTVRTGSGSYTFDVTAHDLFGQVGTVSSLSAAAVATDITQFIASLREGANYSRLIGGAVPAPTKTAWSDGNTTSAGANVIADPNWQWLEVAWDYNERFRTITAGRFAMASGSAGIYFALSTDGTTWTYFAAPLTASGERAITTEVADETAARAAVIGVTNATVVTRWDLPRIVEARFVRLWILKIDAFTLREFYPRRLVQSDDLEAEAVTAVNIAAAAITVDKLAAGAIDGFLITGATYRTAASGARLELTSADGLRSLDSGGNELLRVLGGQGLRITTDTALDNNRAVTFFRGAEDRGGLNGFATATTSRILLRAVAPSSTVQAWIDLEVDNSSGYVSYFTETAHRFFARVGSLRMEITDSEPILLYRSNTTNNTDLPGLRLRRNLSSGTAAANLGTSIEFGIRSTTTDDRNAAAIRARWGTATDASRAGILALLASDSAGEREGLRIAANGSAALIGFFGAAAIARPNVTGSRGGNVALANALTALANLGLITNSTTA